jgi:alkylation response protein AidB-like acyl-CoA dehydrogenase
VTTDDELRSEARAWLEEHAPAMRARLDAARSVKPLLRADEVWCQLFSEPVAGSDQVDAGWGRARAVLAHEASTIGGGNAAAKGYDELVGLAQESGQNNDPLFRQRLADAYAREQILRYLRERVQASVRAGKPPVVDGSVLKVLWAEARGDRAELGVALLGAGGALLDEWPVLLLEKFSGTIGGGTSEVHRNMIGERALGLPAEPRVDRDESYRELVNRRV